MPKKLQSQAEQNGQTLSREDRKNEQIMRMIEKAEKQRQKREEKKKLQVLNKGKSGVSRKQKKMGVLTPKNTQIAINILFSEKARAQNQQNRYFFERKQMIEEKQRIEQEELWTKYAMRVHQMQQQQMQAPQYLPAPPHPSMIGAASSGFNQASYAGAPLPQAHPAQLQYGASSLFGGVANADAARQAPYNLQFQTPQVGPSVASAQLSNPGVVESYQQQNVQPACYLNAGETGGNYEAGNDDHSGSSYLSSASKRQPTQTTAARHTSVCLPAQTVAPGQGSAATALHKMSSSSAPPLHPLLMPAPSQQSLGQVLNELPSSVDGEVQANTAAAAAVEQAEEAKDDNNKQKGREQIKINVQLDQSPGPQQESAQSATLPTAATVMAPLADLDDSAMILELTRKKMSQMRD